MRRAALLFLFLLGLLPAAAAAQVGSTTDILRGRITDELGKPLTGASVEVVSLETGIRRATLTNKDGRYTLIFPDGGGRYRMRVSFIGQAPFEGFVVRQADEDVLVADVRLRTEAIALEGISVEGRRAPPPTRGDVGGQERTLSGEAVSRLPLEETDAATIASLSPGVVGVTDSLGLNAFSVAGQRASLNQVTLDGASFSSMLSGGAFGDSPLGLPQEGVRATSVITNTYDIARGQFSGGQVASTTRGGTNQVQGSFSYSLRDARLQGNTGRTPWADGFTQNRFSGGIGGPLIRDKLFYNLSFSAQQRSDGLYALEPRDPSGFGDLNLSADSVARFLDLLQTRYGLSTLGQTGAFDRTRDALSALLRIDYSPSMRHNLSVRGFGNWSSQDNAGVRSLGLKGSGGASGSDGMGGFFTLTSRFGEGWINELRASLTKQSSETKPREQMPEGRVRVRSLLEDGTTGIATLAFGGGLSPRTSDERTTELTNELSVLLGGSHRVKLGALYNHSAFDQQSAGNAFGTFTFNSLEDFAEGRAATFSRSLAPRVSEGSGWNAALYAGDAWRPTTALQLVYGVRVEGSGFGTRPERNEQVEALFGLRTDQVPSEVHVSPRVGFSWQLNERGRPQRLLRGGFGEFRARTPYALYTDALNSAGTHAETVLQCVGEGSVPAPDFAHFLDDPASIPTGCAGGNDVLVQGGRPAATTFAPGFEAPRSWRGSLGFQAQLSRTLRANIDASYALGVALYGVRDRNLRETPAFALAAEGGRPVFATPDAIAPSTGSVDFFASRVHPQFANVYEVYSGLGSKTALLTVGLNGMLPRRISFQTSYTLSRSTDQSSFSWGGARQGFGAITAGGDPNRPGWSVSDLDRRHSLTTVLSVPVRQVADFSVIARASSGSPFTPRVGGDINGDGARNDAAFLFDPSKTSDPALRAGMETVLASAPAGVRGCLERQLGEVAERNSCRGPWSYSLDLRATARPQVGPLGRRLSLSADLYNVPAGLDLLLHGGNALRGWGQRVFQDDVLLYPRSFDPVAQEFRYEVNEAFGRRRPRGAGRSPFGLQLSARVSVGPERGAGFGGFGGGGMGGGMRVQMRGGPGGPGGGGGEVVTIGPEGSQGGAGGRGSMLERLLPEPISQILALGDSLGLSAEQTAALEAIRDSLVQKNEPIRKEISEVFSAGPIGDPGQLFSQIGSRVNQGRTHVQAALDAAKRTLTPEQWEKVPEEARNSVARSFQQRGGPRGEGGERQGRPRGGRGGSGRSGSGPE